MVIKARKWVLNKKPNGIPTTDDFKCVTEEISEEIHDGEVLLEAEVLTVDPYMRIMMATSKPGEVPVGAIVAKVIKSKNAAYIVGTRHVCYCGWRTHFLLTKDVMKDHSIKELFPEMGDYPISTALGVLGMPGMTAYFGLLEICHPKAGEVVVVNTAGGAVGSIVCQIAKITGCKVIAFAGEESKISWLKELGVDCAANYKTEDVSKILAKEAPDGVHCYFDNVGGDFTSKVLPHMARYGRISICGAISTYNDTTDSSMISPFNSKTIIFKQLKIEGFLVSRWDDKFGTAVAVMKKWLDEGKLKYKETITEGFENMPHAFIGLFKGTNIGKAVVTV